MHAPTSSEVVAFLVGYSNGNYSPLLINSDFFFLQIYSEEKDEQKKTEV